MAKTIKFNLICDEQPVRTLDDLRQNFSVDDVLSYFHNGLLERWLTVRGFNDELAKLKALNPKDDDLSIIRALVNIFGVNDSITDIERDTYIFTYRNEHNATLERYKAMNARELDIITGYHDGYESLIDTIIDNKDDMPRIKAAIQEIDERYYELFYMQFRNLVKLFILRAPMAIFAMLMRPNMRKLYIPEDSSSGTFMIPMRHNAPEEYNRELDYIALYQAIRDIIEYKKLKEILGDNLKEFAGETSGYWKDIEPRSKKCMLLYMTAGNFARPAGENGTEWASNDIYGKFRISDGIDYKSNNKTHKLLYLEV